MKEERCVLLTSGNVPLAQGVIRQNSGTLFQVEIPDGKASDVEGHEIIHLVGTDGQKPLQVQCHLKRLRDDMAVLEKMSDLDPEFRRSLRVPTRFASFVYPISGSWKGRMAVRAIDLSCGGISFYGTDGMEIGETAEVVVPTQSEPILVTMQILRKHKLKNDKTYYAAKFAALQSEEDRLICERVFSLQLSSRPQPEELEEMEETT